MYVVYLDANALYGDPHLTGSQGGELMKLVQAGFCELSYSPVVLGEVQRTVKETLDAEIDGLITRLKALEKRQRVSVDRSLEELKVLRKAAHDRSAERAAEIFSTSGVKEEAWVEVSVEEMVKRELERRRPFVVKEKAGTIGHRDTVIWLGCVELAVGRPGDTVLFVTQDKGFLDNNGKFHGDLLADLQERNVAVSRVVRLRDLFDVVNYLRKAQLAAVDDAPDDRAAAVAGRRANALAAIRQELHEYTLSLANAQWDYAYDPRDGDLKAPDIDAGLPAQLEQVHVKSIESRYDFAADKDVLTAGAPIVCTYTVDVSFEGFMTKSDWYGGADDGLELWDSDWNDHYVAAEAERTLELKVEVTYNAEEDAASVGDLIDSRVL